MTTGPARALLRRLGQFLDQFSACFSRQPQRDAATQYIDGLFGDSEPKSIQAMHGRLGDARDYQALQHFITHSPWDAARVWAQLRAAVPIRSGILALDDTGFPKQGTQSAGVQRQYCGALGKIGNCQVAVSSALIADGRTWPVAFELYLPTSWTDDPARCAAAGVPSTARFREKWRIALAQIRTVLQAGFTITGVGRRRGLRGERGVSRGVGTLGPRVRRRHSGRGGVRGPGRGQSITTSVRHALEQAFDPELREVVSQRDEPVLAAGMSSTAVAGSCKSHVVKMSLRERCRQRVARASARAARGRSSLSPGIGFPSAVGGSPVKA